MSVDRFDNTCAFVHTTWRKGVQIYVPGMCETPEVVISQPRGLTQVKLRCSECNRLSGALPHWLVCELMDQWASPVVREHHAEYPSCSVEACIAPGVDWHHFAPRNTFGPEADSWPVMPLCQLHHREWHQRMDGYRWQARAKAVS